MILKTFKKKLVQSKLTINKPKFKLSEKLDGTAILVTIKFVQLPSSPARWSLLTVSSKYPRLSIRLSHFLQLTQYVVLQVVVKNHKTI